MVQASIEIEERDIHNERNLPEPLAPLKRLAWNYWWSWSSDGNFIFRDLDPSVWEECEHNPRRLLKEVSDFRLMQMATDPGYIGRVRRLAEKFDEYMADAHVWLAEGAETKTTPENPVAYFR